MNKLTMLWPGRPRPLPDETFASWFARTAQANGLMPKDLYRAALPGAYLHGRDLDRLPGPQLIATLEEKTGIDAEAIRATTLATWYGRLIEEDDGLNKLPWLPQYDPVKGHFPGADWPLAVVQIDHTKMDVEVVDETSRQPIGRPWLTLAIDCYSRMITGMYISLDPPSAFSVGMCVAQSILPKDAELQRLDIKGEWPV